MLPLINSIPRTSTVIVELVASWQAGRWQVGGRPSVNQHKTTWSTVRYDFSTYSHTFVILRPVSRMLRVLTYLHMVVGPMTDTNMVVGWSMVG